MIWVAAAGILVNGVTAILFFSDHEHDLNIRGAFLHMAADAAVSAGVAACGLLIMTTGWFWLDPLVSLVICAVIVAGTWGLLRDSLNLALDAVPEGIAVSAVLEYLKALPKVTGVHDLHIWGMSTTEAALTAHLVMKDPICDDAFLMEVEVELHKRFGIEHTTLQLESGDRQLPCRCHLSSKA